MRMRHPPRLCAAANEGGLVHTAAGGGTPLHNPPTHPRAVGATHPRTVDATRNTLAHAAHPAARAHAATNPLRPRRNVVTPKGAPARAGRGRACSRAGLGKPGSPVSVHGWGAHAQQIAHNHREPPHHHPRWTDQCPLYLAKQEVTDQRLPIRQDQDQEVDVHLDAVAY